MYGCESWTVKKAEHWRIDAFELCCWRRLLRVLWTTRSNQSTLKEISTECSLEGLMLRLQLYHFGSPMRRADSEKNDAGKDWRREEKGTTEDEIVGWHYQLDGHEFEQALRVGDGQGNLVCFSPWGLQRVGHDWVTELNWSDPRIEFWSHIVALLLFFWETSIPFFTVAAPIYISISSVWGFPFLHILANICYLWSFWR